MRKLICSDFASSVLLKVDDSVGVNDIDVSLYIPRDVEETGITVASLERFSTYASDRDGEYAAFSGLQRSQETGLGRCRCVHALNWKWEHLAK